MAGDSLIVFFVVVLLFILSFGVYKYMKKREYDSKYRILCLTPLFVPFLIISIMNTDLAIAYFFLFWIGVASFIIFIVAPIGLPIFLGYAIYKHFNKQGNNRWLRILALVPIIISSILVYNYFYPSQGYYKNEYREITKMEFPESGKIRYKSKSEALWKERSKIIFIVEMSESSYSHLYAWLKDKPDLDGFNNTMETDMEEMNFEIDLSNKKHKFTFYNEENNTTEHIIFLSNNKSVFFYKYKINKRLEAE